MIATPAITTCELGVIAELDLRDVALERARELANLVDGWLEYLPLELQEACQLGLCGFWSAYWLSEALGGRNPLRQEALSRVLFEGGELNKCLEGLWGLAV